MPTESPQHPQPDDLPEDQRTGGEPNPSGSGSPNTKPAANKPAASPPKKGA